MVSEDKAKRLQAEEVARQTAPDTKHSCGQIVKLGTLCPACGIKVN